jgi:hypothetical protein
MVQLFSTAAAKILIRYTTHTIRKAIATGSDDLGDDEVLMLLGATARVLLACWPMCRSKSDVNGRGSIPATSLGR